MTATTMRTMAKTKQNKRTHLQTARNQIEIGKIGNRLAILIVCETLCLAFIPFISFDLFVCLFVRSSVRFVQNLFFFPSFNFMCV